MKARRLASAAALSLGVCAAGVVSAPAAVACVPHVNSQGPTVTVAPDYSHPLQSDYGYDSDGTYVEVVTCLG
jgi:hypothetical protein